MKKSFRLHPVAFLSCKPTTKSELTWHSYVGEAVVGHWAMQKWKIWLLGRPLTWLADCSGLKRFFDECLEDIPRLMIQQWQMELLQFKFDLQHRLAVMLTDCDTLTRYNKAAKRWREETEAQQQQTKQQSNQQQLTTSVVMAGTEVTLFEEQILVHNWMPEVFSVLHVLEYHGEAQLTKAELSARFLSECAVLTEGCFAVLVPEALQALGLPQMCMANIDEFDGPDNQRHPMEVGASSSSEFWEMLTGTMDDVNFDWYISVYNKPHVLVGVHDVALSPWLRTELVKITALVEHTSLQVAMLWIPS